MAKALAIVKLKEENPKPKRERIGCIETMPDDSWFVRSKTSRGRVVWYLHLQMTGMHSRLCGPFTSKRQSLLFLDDAIAKFSEWSCELTDLIRSRMIRQEFQDISMPPIIEYPIISQAHSALRKER